MDIRLLSEDYEVRRLTENDLDEILMLCKDNTLYYAYCPPFVSRQSIISDMYKLPPHKEMKDKYYVGYYENDQLIAILDLILSYPDEKTAFIGFFMMDVSLQKQGIGTEIIHELRASLKRQGFTQIRLGWVKGNPQAEHFWKKNGFSETGITYDTGGYTVVVASRMT